jgi:ribosome biogenesis SPOUT family RNA methylase Rps3
VRFDGFHCIITGVEGDARERLADVECVAVAVVVAVVGLRDHRVAVDRLRQEARVQRDADDPPTSRRAASSKNNSAGRCLKGLKIS